jgi:hypothetical protein
VRVAAWSLVTDGVFSNRGRAHRRPRHLSSRSRPGRP